MYIYIYIYIYFYRIYISIYIYIYMVRGELSLSKTAWSSINGERKNPRNTVAGIANSKKPDKKYC